MNTMKWLVRREFWEHKGGFFWAPIVVGAFWTLLIAGTLFILTAMGKNHGIDIGGDTVTDLSHAMTAHERLATVSGIASSYMIIAAPVFFVLTITVFFFAIGSLYDDRRDRSVLFWKSLPVSDSATVASKLAMGLIAAPMIAIVVATAVSLVILFSLTLCAAFMGINIFGALAVNSALYLSPFEVVAMLPVYAAWALPTIGWLVLVSAWARTMPFLWSVGTPLFAGLLLSFFNAIFHFGWNVAWFWENVVGRMLGGTLPGEWFFYHPGSVVRSIAIDNGSGTEAHGQAADVGLVMVQSWKVFATSDLWIGAAIGAVMIVAAIRLRRWRDEG